MKKVLIVCLLHFGGWATAQNIAAIEYFIDEQDPGVGNGISLTIDDNTGQLTQNFSIPTTGLGEGFHSLNIRSQSASGSWSLYDRSIFFIAPVFDVGQGIATAEYFFDIDPGLGNGTSLSLNTITGQLTQSIILPTTNLAEGIHSLYIRAQNAAGDWSLYDRTIFYIKAVSADDAPLASAEYFFNDEDPGIGNATSIALDENTGQLTQSLALATEGLTEGQHTVYIRVQAQNGIWSLYDKATFTIDPAAIDNAVALENELLTANFDATGATYQWLDCDDAASPISNETNRSFSPETSGNYAVQISFNNETVVSACIGVVINDSAEDHFVTTWKTDNTDADDTNIEIPTIGDGYNYDIDWNNDGVFDELGITGDISHDYIEPGTYTIRIRGSFPRIFIANNEIIRNKLLSVDQWGSIQWQSMERAFQGAVYLVLNASDTPDLRNVSNMRSMFQFAYSLNQNINNWDVSNVTNMRFMFYYALRFDQPLDNWDVSKVTDMEFMFSNAPLFNQPLNNWDVGNVTNMESMFSIVDVEDPFELIPPDEEDGLFNQNLSDWNVSNVTNMKAMFEGATSFNGEINQWDVSKVTDMSDMFRNTLAFNQPIGGWNVSNVTDLSGMFSSSPGPVFGGGPEMQFNQPLNDWDVGNVTDISGMFSFSENFNQPLDNWNVSNVTDMSFMFLNADEFNQPLDNWDVSNVIDMGGVFQDTRRFNMPLDSWDVSKVELMDVLFDRALSFNQSLATWNVSNVTNMSSMFLGVKLSTSNYDETLSAWSRLTLQPNVIFTGGSSNFCEAEEERNAIINTYNWTISDGGLDCTSFTLPSSNFTLKTTGESCIDKDDGGIELTAVEELAYTLTLSGTSQERFNFTDILEISNLSAGDYEICITVDGEPDYEQCFEVRISEPESISASSKVNLDEKTVTLDLRGSENYTIQLNGKTYRTNEPQITLNLNKVENSVVVFGEKGCQGTYEEMIVMSDNIFAYPNPIVSEQLSVYLGSSDEFSNVRGQLFDLTGAMVLNKHFDVTDGYIRIDMISLTQGTYILSITNQTEIYNQKILKQ